MKEKMKVATKGIVLGIAMLLLGLTFFSGPAYAIPYLDVYLTNWNVEDLQATGDKIHVTAENTGANTTLTFTFVYGTATPAIQLSPQKGINELGWNSSATILTYATGWATDSSSCNLDGFGCFSVDEGYTGVMGNTGAGVGPIAFVLAGNSLSFSLSTGTGGGHQFAAHVQFGNDCSGFVSDGTHATTTDSGGPGCASTQVPEPTSLILLGSGLAGLGLWGRKRLVIK